MLNIFKSFLFVYLFIYFIYYIVKYYELRIWHYKNKAIIIIIMNY